MATNKRTLRDTTAVPAQLDAMETWAAHVDAHKDEIQAANKLSREAGQERGATAAFAASRATGFTLDAAAMWVPIAMDPRAEDKTRKDAPGDMLRELSIRERHAIAEPETSPLVIAAMRGHLQLVANASKDETVATARKVTRVIPARKGAKEGEAPNAAQAKRDLTKLRDDAVKLGDHGMAAVYSRHVDAIDNPGRMFAIANDISAATKAYSRWRSYLFLAPIEQTFKSVVPEDMWGRKYEKAASIAQAAHKDYMTGNDAQHRSVAGLTEKVLGAVTDYFAPMFVYESKSAAIADGPDNDAIGAKAISQLFYYSDKALSVGYITKAQWQNIRDTLTMRSTLARVQYEDGTEDFLAYPDPKPAKAEKTPKAPKPQTSKGKDKAKAAPAKSEPAKPQPAKSEPVPVTVAPIGRRGNPPPKAPSKVRPQTGGGARNLQAALAD